MSQKQKAIAKALLVRSIQAQVEGRGDRSKIIGFRSRNGDEICACYRDMHGQTLCLGWVKVTPEELRALHATEEEKA